MEIAVYNQKGEKSGLMELPKVFELPWNPDLVHQVVTSQMANRRQPVAHVKGRGEVRGGGRKPWRQKGTGRARAGSIRSPIWKGGGVTHGPSKEKKFKKKINKKMAKKALAAVLSAKVRDGELVILDDLKLAGAKTKEAANVFQKLSKIKPFADIAAKEARTLLLFPDAAPELRRAFRNLPFVVPAEARNITALDVLSRKYVVAPKASIEVLTRRFGA